MSLFQRAHSFTSKWVSSGTPTVIAFQRACGVTSNGPTIPLLHLLMVIGAGLGNELFFISFLPFLFWEVDDSIARRIIMQWGIVYYVGQALKDMVQLPRPPASIVIDAAGIESVVKMLQRSPKSLLENKNTTTTTTTNSSNVKSHNKEEGVVRLERHYETEGGMPSTHSMNAMSMPWLIYYLGREKAILAFGSDIPLIVFACLWTVLCISSRLYLGVHSPADIIVGACLGLIIMAITVSFGASIDLWVLYGPYAYPVLFIVTVFLVIIYPRPSSPRWISTPGDTSLIMGAITGIFCASRLCVDLGSGSTGNGVIDRDRIVFTDRVGGLGSFGSLIRAITGFLVLVLTRAVCKPIFVFIFETLVGPEYVLESDLVETPTSRSLGPAKQQSKETKVNSKINASVKDDNNMNDNNGTLRRRNHIDLKYDNTNSTSASSLTGDVTLAEDDLTMQETLKGSETSNKDNDGKVPGLKISLPGEKVKVPSGQRYAVELPTKYCVYFVVGFNCLFTCKWLFQQMGAVGKDFGLPRGW